MENLTTTVTSAVAKKAFDTKELWDRVKAKASLTLKEPLKAAVGETLDWASEGCVLKGGALMVGLGGVIAGTKPAILAEIDKLGK